MTKREFLRSLSRALSLLKFSERQRTIAYYSEMIDDAIDAGESEEEVIARLGSPDEIAAQILSEAASRGELKKKVNPLSAILMVLGSPVWLPLLLAAVIVVGSIVFVIYVVAWALIIVAFAVVFALVAAGIAGCIGLFAMMARNAAGAFFIFGAGLVCSGLAMFLIIPLWTASKQIVHGTAQVCSGIWHRATDRFWR